MGLLVSRLWRAMFGWWRKEYKVVMVGLDGAGKTTILFQLHLGELVETQPTVGSNVETVRYNGLSLVIWDLAGQTSRRSMWQTYYAQASAVILVIDSTDAARLSVVKQELSHLLSDATLSQAVLLVFANKQDLTTTALPSARIAEELGLPAIRSHSWHITPCSARTGHGLYDGIHWMTGALQQQTGAAPTSTAKFVAAANSKSEATSGSGRSGDGESKSSSGSASNLDAKEPALLFDDHDLLPHRATTTTATTTTSTAATSSSSSGARQHQRENSSSLKGASSSATVTASSDSTFVVDLSKSQQRGNLVYTSSASNGDVRRKT